MQHEQANVFELIEENGVHCKILLNSDNVISTSFFSQILSTVCVQLIITYWVPKEDDGSKFCNWQILSLFSQKEIGFLLSTWWSLQHFCFPWSIEPADRGGMDLGGNDHQRRCFYALLLARMVGTKTICELLPQLPWF